MREPRKQSRVECTCTTRAEEGTRANPITQTTFANSTQGAEMHIWKDLRSVRPRERCEKVCIACD